MDLLYVMRDLGVADPAVDSIGEETVRAALAREIEKATDARRPGGARRRSPRAYRSRRRVLAGGTLGLAGICAAVLLALSATSPPPAFAVTRHRDGTVTISIMRASGIAGVNAKLHELGIRATVARQAPAYCQPARGQVAVPSGSAGASAEASANWTIAPGSIPPGSQLVLTPPPAPPGTDSGNSGNSGNSGTGGNSGSGGVCLSHGSQAPVSAGPPPGAPSGNTGNSGNSGNS